MGSHGIFNASEQASRAPPVRASPCLQGAAKSANVHGCPLHPWGPIPPHAPPPQKKKELNDEATAECSEPVVRSKGTPAGTVGKKQVLSLLEAGLRVRRPELPTDVRMRYTHFEKTPLRMVGERAGAWSPRAAQGEGTCCLRLWW